MHGLINRALQCFVRDTYGTSAWREISCLARLEFEDFEALLVYPDELTDRAIDAACGILNKPRDDMFEDLGTYLISHPNLEALRRLMRFGGVGFVDFLHSLDDLADRAKLAVPDLDLPRLRLLERSPSQFDLQCDAGLAGYGRVLVGVLRAMADDYGALVILEHTYLANGREMVSIDMPLAEFAKGREFQLAGPSAR